MGLFELFLLAVGLSMDAFAVAISKGLTMGKVTIKKVLVVGLYFGIFQAGMPLIGYFLAMQFADRVVALSTWISFGLLSFLGGKMVIGSLKKKTPPEGGDEDKNALHESGGKEEYASTKKEEYANTEADLSPRKMLPLAVATSIDALAVGVSLAFLHVNIISAVLLIGATTLVISMIGVKIGNIFGTRFRSKAELLGGVILLGIGVHILVGHFLW